jgi:uncharacterized protein (TIGR02246 family)
MKRLLILIPLVLLCCLGCQQGEKVVTVDVEADIQAIKDIVADCNAAANTADADRGLVHYADDAVVMPANAPADIGKEVIRTKAKQAYGEVTAQEELVVEDVKISGDLAVARVTWSGIFTRNDSGKSWKQNGNWIWVFKKQPDSVWKIIYSIWSNESLVRPPLPE